MRGMYKVMIANELCKEEFDTRKGAEDWALNKLNSTGFLHKSIVYENLISKVDKHVVYVRMSANSGFVFSGIVFYVVLGEPNYPY